jgi:hypothetical protein
MNHEFLFTVAAIRRPKGEETVEYLFNESPRIFKLDPALSKDKAVAEIIDSALMKKTPMKVSVDPVKSLINKVSKPSEVEIKAFIKERVFLENPQRPRAIDVEKIDHTLFNYIEVYLKDKIFWLCLKIVPNYAKAKEIFDFCAKQSCHLPGPHDVNPCIPFQYVRDGCYARAHKMRWIITTKYRYCCEKVFSFANQDNDILAVQASKWGGCCVQWWYHVAPLIRVKVKLLTFTFHLAMVIDPGMFDYPVLLSVWLAAQANKTCSPRARVSMYSLQPGSAYSPANYGGTQYTTDNNYVSTDATLTAYRNLHTCP